MTVLNGRLGAHLRLQSKAVGIASGQLILLRQTLCRLELTGEFALLKIATSNRFTHFLVSRNGVATDGHPRHVLDATGHHYIRSARADDVVGKRRRLLRRSTLRVDGDARRFSGAAIRQPRCARNVHTL